MKIPLRCSDEDNGSKLYVLVGCMDTEKYQKCLFEGISLERVDQWGISNIEEKSSLSLPPPSPISLSLSLSPSRSREGSDLHDGLPAWQCQGESDLIPFTYFHPRSTAGTGCDASWKSPSVACSDTASKDAIGVAHPLLLGSW